MNTQDNIRAESHKDPAQLEREIDQKRGNIEQIVSALENRLSPSEMFDRVMRSGGGKEFASNLADTVKANPVPALLTAAGLVWLYAGRNDSPATRSTSYRTSTASPYAATAYGSSDFDTTSTYESSSSDSSGMRDKIHAARDKISSAGSRVSEGTHNMATSVRDHASSAAGSVRDRASSAGQSVKHGARRANDGMQRLLNENPMAAAGIGIAVGALLGALMPVTRKEDELLGQHSDRLTGKAKEFARTGADTIKDASREVTSPQGGDSQGASSASSTPVTPSAVTGASTTSSASSGAASRPH
ncbi:DUF3618 domain-containing protein [Cognatilysobacter bugurensis]|uniref:DUF3618 domain-containing protein n=1 Tax=Cognatilysobacter bugurensis TaxID=543356 RepID=A0A918W7F7_9GAMM|nr:DUF3618 domain-containing protein [Lysobacter bugurensis]GHA73795.1 hypothetical protein GCM10007067_08320 [Lysobacter bugurensis]